MPATEMEQVLVVPTSLLHKLGYFQGFTGAVDRYFEELLSPEHTSYRPRDEMEQDPRYKQLIPYVIFRHQGPDGVTQLFHYTRGKGQGERRLHSKRSIGIGGHISSDDAASPDDVHAIHPYDEGMRRELAEEVFVESNYHESCVGLINDDETEVGRVHLGVVHLFDVETCDVRPREAEIASAGFSPVDDLMRDLDDFESWSQICLQALFG